MFSHGPIVSAKGPEALPAHARKTAWVDMNGMPLLGITSTLLVTGIGLDATNQVLVLMVRNQFPISQVGMATASNNNSRQIGASLGSAVVGNLFAHRLAGILTTRMEGSGSGTGMGGINSLTPQIVRQLPEQLRNIVGGDYNDALTTICVYLVPLRVAGMLLLLIK